MAKPTVKEKKPLGLFTRLFLPGIIDGFLIWTGVNCVAAYATKVAITMMEEQDLIQTLPVLASMTAIQLAIAAMCSSWVVFSSGSMVSRSIVALGLGVLPLLISVPSERISYEATAEVIISHHAVWLLWMSVAGLILRPFTRKRIAVGAEPKVKDKWFYYLLHYIPIIAISALVVVNSDYISDYYLERGFSIAGAVLLVTIALVWIPAFRAFFRSPTLPAFALNIFGIIALIGTVWGSIALALALEGRGPRVSFSDCAWSALAAVSFSVAFPLTVFLIVLWAKTNGFYLAAFGGAAAEVPPSDTNTKAASPNIEHDKRGWLRRVATWILARPRKIMAALVSGAQPPTRWYNPWIFVPLGILGLVGFLCVQSIDLPTLYRDGLGRARYIASLERALGTDLECDKDGIYQELNSQDTLEVVFDDTNANLKIDIGLLTDDPMRFMPALSRHPINNFSLTLTNPPDCIDLNRVSLRVANLRLDAPSIDTEWLRTALDRWQVETLTILGDTSTDLVAAVVDSPANLSFLGRIRYDAKAFKALTDAGYTDFRTRFTTIRIEDGTEVESFSNMTFENLNLDGSHIDESIVEKIEDCKSLRSIHFTNCSFTEGAIDRMAEWNIHGMLFNGLIDLDGTPAKFKMEHFGPLAENPHVAYFNFYGDSNPLFDVHFGQRSGRSSYSSRQEPPLLLLEAVQAGTPVNQAISQIANRVERNSDGDVIGLDMADIRLSIREYRYLAELEQLRHLRICNPGQSVDRWSSIGLDKLDSLEIPMHGISNADIDSLSNLTNLRRLQLPLRLIDGRYTYRPIQPDRLIQPQIDRLNTGALTTAGYVEAIELYSISNESDEPLLSSTGILPLQKLTKLEYLFLPGWLLDDKSLEVIESLENLNELHAPMGDLSASMTDRIARLKNLKRLTLSVAQLTDDIAEPIKTLTHLEELTLYILDDKLKLSPQLTTSVANIETTNARAVITKQVQQLLPNVKVKVLFVPVLALDPDSSDSETGWAR